MSKLPSNPKLVWMDFETTGLDPRKGLPLEVAVVLTEPDLTTIWEQSFVIHWSLTELPLKELSPFILDMHSKNGLLDEVYRSGWDIKEVDIRVSDLIQNEFEIGDLKPPLAGSTISFDRSWLEVWMPDTTSVLHYRNFDVSTFKEAARRWKPEVALPTPETEAHRALPDIRESIEAARHYRDSLFA